MISCRQICRTLSSSTSPRHALGPPPICMPYSCVATDLRPSHSHKHASQAGCDTRAMTSNELLIQLCSGRQVMAGNIQLWGSYFISTCPSLDIPPAPQGHGSHRLRPGTIRPMIVQLKSLSSRPHVMFSSFQADAVKPEAQVLP